MIVSIAIAVLPVWRSPMISSRWPRPIGIIESIAFSPVCIGSTTGWRWTTPGALCSAGAGLGGVDLALVVERAAERVDQAAEQLARRPGSRSSLPVRFTVSPSDDLVPLAEEHGADVVLLEVERQPDHVVRQLEHLERHAVVEPVDAGDPVADLEHGADLREVGGLDVQALDPLAQDAGDLVWLDFHLSASSPLPTPPGRRSFAVSRACCGCSRPGPCCRPAGPARRGCRRRPGSRSSTVLPVCCSISDADPLDDLGIELDRAGHGHVEPLVLLRPRARRTGGGSGRSPASGASRSAARGS